MAIIRKGVDKVGSLSIKKVYEKTIDDSSQVEQAIALMWFPAYTHLGYIHSLSWEIVGASAMVPQSYTECIIRGSIDNTERHETQIASDDWDVVMEDFLPADPDQLLDHGATDSVDITGEEHVASTGHEFFRRSYTLGFPTNAYPTATDRIRYKASGRYKGHVRTRGFLDISAPKIMAIGALSKIPGVETDKSNSAGGGYANNELLYAALLDNFPSNSEEVGPTLGTAMAAEVEDYLYHGVRQDTHAVTDSLHIRMTLSGRLDLYKPSSSKYVPAP